MKYKKTYKKCTNVLELEIKINVKHLQETRWSARILKEKKLFWKKKFRFLQPLFLPGHPCMGSLKNFSTFGPAVWPAVANIQGVPHHIRSL